MKKLLVAIALVLTLASCTRHKKIHTVNDTTCVFGSIRNFFEPYRYNPNNFYVTYFQ